jgi:hypothetical protein
MAQSGLYIPKSLAKKAFCLMAKLNKWLSFCYDPEKFKPAIYG